MNGARTFTKKQIWIGLFCITQKLTRGDTRQR